MRIVTTDQGRMIEIDCEICARKFTVPLKNPGSRGRLTERVKCPHCGHRNDVIHEDEELA